MQPLVITRYSVVNCLGIGARAVAEALFAGRSGLAPCDFEDVAFPTHVGRVRALEAQPVRADLAAFECRNNRLAQLALETDGFAAAVAEARERYGAARWIADLSRRGFAVDATPMSQGTPFCNVLFVARKVV